MSQDHVEIGVRHVFGGEAPFGVSRTDLRQHLYVIGKTGTGKSTLLRNMLIQQIIAGEGVGLIDPHGDLAEDLLCHIPARRLGDTIYFNPADQDYPFAFNLLQAVEPQSRHLVASAIVGGFKSVWKESWGPRLEYILYSCVAALLDCQNTTILGVPRMLIDGRYREWILRQVKNTAVSNFWINEFGGWDKRFAAEAISPIQNKVGQLLMAEPMRLVLGQVASRFTPRFTMDHRRIFIANLAKGRLGEDKANLLGAMLVSAFQNAAMQRAEIPEQGRVDFTLYVDEFQSFASSDSFAAILSEMRKMRLGIVLSHQYIEQVPPEIRHAVFGNVGSLISFRVGESDAAVLSREFGSGFDPRLFANLANKEICVKLLEDGNQLDPFLARTNPPSGKRYGREQDIIHQSRQRFGTPRAMVEDRIARWMSR